MKGAPCKKSPFRHHHTGPEDGLALFGALAGAALFFALGVLLLTALKRNSDSSTAATRELNGKLALELAAALLAGDLLAELRAGSRTVDTGTAGALLYYPATALSAAPYRPAGLAPNLLRQSRRETAFYDATLTCTGESVYPEAAGHPAGRPALAASTETPALNFSGISAARWNAPALLPRPSGSRAEAAGKKAVLSGTSRVGGQDTAWAWTAPDWVVLRRDGTAVGEWSPGLRSTPALAPYAESASLRYAYQIYDCGGLLDLNHAGYDPGELAPEKAARKGSTAFADLTQIGLSAEATRALVRWRNVALDGAPCGPPYGHRLLNVLLGPARGPYWWASWNSQKLVSSERRFATRKQLLTFLEALPPNE